MFKHLSLLLALTMLPVTASPAMAALSRNHILDLDGSLADGLNPSLTLARLDEAVLGTTGDGFTNSLDAAGPVLGDTGSALTPVDPLSEEGSWIVDANGIHDPKPRQAPLAHVYSGLPET